MEIPFSRRPLLKIALVALALLGAGFAAAQTIGAADRVLLLQAKRFEGSYKLPTGETSVKVGDNGADWKLASGTTNLAASLAPAAGKPDRATLSLDGRTLVGKATIDGKVLTMEFPDGKTVYRIRLTLSGRNEGDLKVTKDDTTLVAGALKRA